MERSIIDGSLYWGIAGVPDPVALSTRFPAVRPTPRCCTRRQTLHGARRLQFWGANANRYYEYSGGAGLRSMWMDAIEQSHPDWVEIITWNDFIEGTYISPIDDPNRYPRRELS